MPEAQVKELEKLLANMEKVGASDLHLKVGSPPIYRVHGQAQRLKGDPLSFPRVKEMIYELLSPDQARTLETTGGVDMAVSIPGAGRFRANVFIQRGAPSFCARRVNSEIPSFENLLLPKPINRLPATDDGLVLVVGMTGSGKSTTLAAIIQRINQSRRSHILTIEDPIEYVYRDDKCFINQREIGIDTPDFPTALKYAMRQDPDVILIGEMRDQETVETALAAAETGHLVLATLHAQNAMQTIARILDFFPSERQSAIRQMLAYTLRAIIAQRLLPGIKPENPRVPAVELCFINPVVRKFIASGEDNRIPEAIRNAAQDGMQDFNMSLYRLAKAGYISEEVALERSPNPEQLAMQFKGMVLNQDKGTL